jgi:pimeloyl-ACP methyl ester carboxylesterase
MKKLIAILILLINPFISSSFSQPTPSFAVTQSGNGKQAIIFIPGFASSGDVWKETVAVLDKQYTCYVLTMPGFAGQKPEANPLFDDWKKQIAAYIKKEKINKPVLIGHSMGGGLALAIAADYPDLISKIVVVDAVPCLAGLMDPKFKSNPANDCSGIVSQFVSLTDEQFAQKQRMSIPSLVADTSKYSEIVNWSLHSDRKTFAQMFCDFSNTDLREKISNITVPSMILLEAYFKNIEPAIKDQYKHLKNADLRFAQKGLHFVMYDDIDWYLNQLNDFLTHP